MKYIIENDCLAVTVSDYGAELQSIYCRKTETEYLWQGDPRYWEGRAPNLFPYIGRLSEGKYTYGENEYKMLIHGLAPYKTFSIQQVSRETMDCILMDDEETYKEYPFHFRFTVRYHLIDNTLCVRYIIENRDDKTMYFGVGGHPGINVPISGTSDFTDWSLRFNKESKPMRIGFSPDCFVNGKDTPFSLSTDGMIGLRHDMFDDDAIVLSDSGGEIDLICPKEKHSVHMEYSDFSYLGLWHWPNKEAPYVCIEPWSSLPSRKGIIEDIERQADLLSLPGKTKMEKEWKLTMNYEG